VYNWVGEYGGGGIGLVAVVVVVRKVTVQPVYQCSYFLSYCNLTCILLFPATSVARACAGKFSRFQSRAR
jgi:hypothetical protein